MSVAVPAATEELLSSRLFQVNGQVAVVTGGGTGIGLMAAQALAANGNMFCATVYIAGRRKEAVETAAKAHTYNGKIIPLGGFDVRKKEDLERLVNEVGSRESHVNILITAAGIPGNKADPGVSDDASEVKNQLWENESPEAWNEVYDADVTSVYFTVVAFLPLLQKASSKVAAFHGCVITISSMSGLIRHAQAHFNYNAAKAATAHLSKMMSAEFSQLGVRVNSIAPGYFPSELTAKESRPDQKSELPHSYVEQKNHVPANRPGVDDEMAQAVLFLAKNMYVNGQVIPVDGGVMNVMGS